MTDGDEGRLSASRTAVPAGLPAAVDRFLARWEQLASFEGWSVSLVWKIPEVVRVAESAVSGQPVDRVLFELGYQRGLAGTGPAELEFDVRALARAWGDDGADRTARLLTHALEGFRVATAATALESSLVDPFTGLDSPAGLVATLWTPRGGRRLRCDELWVCRWAVEGGPWRKVASRMNLAGAVRPLLGRRDAAAFLGESTLAAVVDDPERRAELERAVRAAVAVTECVVHELPEPDVLPALIKWLLSICPELATALLHPADAPR
ncbi:hypothetical protein AB0A74_01325 [Saccharothrix sp. NPDC042600]|uniref:hypothetical protein n=1 Tax=Saccharothrix TaxID=2071 RepID=UPI0033D9E60E|nr:hypothetical protein GCM10017745_49740 [Saccharothrix mutabilis subsp. capreolus]